MNCRHCEFKNKIKLKFICGSAGYLNDGQTGICDQRLNWRLSYFVTRAVKQDEFCLGIHDKNSLWTERDSFYFTR